jgi:DNA-binding XRE family transcriptional regulator
MPVSLKQILSEESPEVRAKVAAKVAELRAEEMSLQQMRKALHLTQAELAQRLAMSQHGVSKLEKRTDLHVSTLRNAVAALGGELVLRVEFPGRAPLTLSGIAERSTAKKKKAVRAGKKTGRSVHAGTAR